MPGMRSVRLAYLLSLLLVGCTSSPSLTAEDWASWRGPRGNGLAPSEAPLTWGRDENVKWRVPLGLPANGSPIVVGDRIFLTTPEDAEGKQRSLYCYAREDGRELWSRTVDFGRVTPTHPTNPYCATTPASDGEVVVVWHASAGLHAYDMDGTELWSHQLGEFTHDFGYGTSPIVHRGKVYLNTGPGTPPFVACFDLRSGEMLWTQEEADVRTAEEIEQKRLSGSWCTPTVIEDGGRELLLCGQPTRVCAYDLDDGTLVWSCEGVAGKRGNLTYSTPAVGEDMCVVVGGWEGPTVGVAFGGEGDVTATHQLWRHAGQMSNCASGIFYEGSFLIPTMNGMLHNIDPATGEATWRKRIARGNTWGSIVQVGDRLYLMNQDGNTVVFRPDDEGIDVLAENALDEPTNATLAIAGGEIYLRTHEHLYCIAADG